MRLVRRSPQGEGGSIFRVGVIGPLYPHSQFATANCEPPRKGEA
jgi:hypothetical protein